MTAQPGFVPNVARLGTGPRAALALHCTMAYSGAWSGFMRGAEDRITCFAPDMPSHGKSIDWDDVSDFSDTVFEASRATLTAPMDVVGHSFGGAIALRLAIECPDKVRSLTMIEPVFFCVAQQDAPKTIAGHDRDAAPFHDHLANGDRDLAARAFNRMWSETGPPWDSLPEGLRRAMTRAIHVVPDTMAFLYRDSAGLLDRLNTIRCPTLLMRGGKSHAVIAATNTGLARRIPGAQDVVIPNAGHMAPITHPRDSFEIWDGFLKTRVG